MKFLKLTAVLAIGFMSCANNVEADVDYEADTTEQVEDVMVEVQDDERKTVETRIENSIEKIDTELEQLGNKIENKSADASEATKQEWQERKADLEDARAELSDDLKAVRGDMKEGWNDFKAGVDRKINDVFDNDDND